MSRAFGHTRRWGWDMRGQKGRLSYLSSDAPMYLQTNALWAQCGSRACKIVSEEFTPYGMSTAIYSSWLRLHTSSVYREAWRGCRKSARMNAAQTSVSSDRKKQSHTAADCIFPKHKTRIPKGMVHSSLLLSRRADDAGRSGSDGKRRLRARPVHTMVGASCCGWMVTIALNVELLHWLAALKHSRRL